MSTPEAHAVDAQLFRIGGGGDYLTPRTHAKRVHPSPLPGVHVLTAIVTALLASISSCGACSGTRPASVLMLCMFRRRGARGVL